ncbi:MAG: hypothetical protein AB2693_30490 [Candidatus Thiodiazotropha sp.]
MLPKPGEDDRVGLHAELPLQDLGEARAYVFGKGGIDGLTGHTMGGVSEPKRGNKPSRQC